MDTEFEDNDEFGFYEAECAGCDSFTRVDDVGLCSDCAGKLERDLIRERDWDYSALAYGVPPEKREELRQHVIKAYGEALELIAPSGRGKQAERGASSTSRHKKSKRRKR